MSFKSIKGQDKPIQRLRDCLRKGQLAGAYLFSGPEGVGKSLVAMSLAKAVNCLNYTNDSCDACAPCLKINKHSHPDLHIIESKQDSDTLELKIDYIRQLQQEINLRPFEGKKKVFIIHDAHNLTQEASNAFLKTLEEPPKDSIIILISAKPELILKTIISRCQVLKFSALKRKELEGLLKKEYSLDYTTVHFLAYFSEGRIGAALRLKETDILKEKNSIINEFILPSRHAENFISASRKNFRSSLNIMASWFRDIYLLKSGVSPDELINLDRKEELLGLLSRYTLAEIEQVINTITDSLISVDQNINVKLLVSNLKLALKI